MALSNNSPVAAPAARPQTIAHALLFKSKVSKEQAMDAMKRANNSQSALPGIFIEMGISDVDIAEAQRDLSRSKLARQEHPGR